jgi:hypothetical protein
MVAAQARPAYIYDTTLGDWVPMSGVVDTGQAYTFTANQTFNGLVNANNGINAATTLSLQTGGTTRLSIDSSGRSLSPFQPAFNATYTDGGVTFSAGVVVFNVARTNIGNHYSTSTGRFTAPVSGHYHFDVHFFKFASYTNPSNTYWGFRRNGGAIITTNHGVQGSDGGQSLNTTIYLNTNDYIDVSTQGTLQTWGDQFMHFSGYLVG